MNPYVVNTPETKPDQNAIVEEVSRLTSQNIARDEVLLKVAALLEERFDTFDWVGFYLDDPDKERMLKLGPYVGAPTDHTQIPYGKGICGQSAESEETFVVQDVSQEDNYIACSIDVEAEIVVPIMKNGRFVAQLDIDSHVKGSITAEQQQMLEQICEQLAELF